MHLEVLVEEESAEEALALLIPKIVPGTSFKVHRFNGKRDLLLKLPSRLQGYRSLSWDELRIVVLIDEDRQNCTSLKLDLEEKALQAGFTTKASAGEDTFQVLNRIAVEELEAWFFGDVAAINAAYQRVSPSLGRKAKYRDPDSIGGGTWEALERVLQTAGYHRGGLAKIRAA